MSDGHYCLVRDLGLVKGGKGMRHHEVVVDFSYRGIKVFAKQGASSLMRRVAAKLAQHESAAKLPAQMREPQ